MTIRIRHVAPGHQTGQTSSQSSRRGFLGGAAGLGLAAAMPWLVSPLAVAQSLEPGLVLNAGFPPKSGPGHFLEALGKQLSAVSGIPASVVQADPARMQAVSGVPGNLFVFSNQEMFPPAGAKPFPLADMVARLQPVMPLLVNPYFVAVSAKSDYRMVGELIEKARKSPGAVRYGSWGSGSLGRKYGAVLAHATGTSMMHVAYPNLPALYAALANGEVDWALGTSIGPAAAALQAGKIRYIAIADSARDAAHDVPTLVESGGPAGMYFRAWLGVFADAKADRRGGPDIRHLLKTAMTSPALRQQYPSMPASTDMTSERLHQYMTQEPQASRLNGSREQLHK